MSALLVIGTTLAGAVVGGAIGVVRGAHEDRGSDLPMGFALYGGVGVILGGFAGVVIGAAVFA